MAKDEFHPKLGRIRSKASTKNQRYLNRVLKTMRQASQSNRNSGRSSFVGSRSARGYTNGTTLAARSFQPGRRRVVIKARFTRFTNGNISAARAHLRYIQRDGVTREGEPGELYGPKSDRVDGKEFLLEAENDRHQFRFIVAPEDSAQMEDLEPFIRDLMKQAESDLGTKLDWVAVDHFNTGHPHTHIIVRGKDDLGNDLVIARDYLSHGLRERARDLVTLELGIETRHELDRKISAEVQSERFTRIDRSLINDTDMGILTISSSPRQDQQYLTHRVGRLRKLEHMGLAEELKPGVWKIAERTEKTLRQLGERGDIMKTMQRALKDAGLDRGVSDYSVFDTTKPDQKITGKIVAIGFSNEMQDQHYVVVDGTDGKLHYAEIGRLSKYDPPSKEMVVTMRGSDSKIQLGKSQKPPARIFIESHVPFSNLASTEGATWLDRKLLTRKPETYCEKGFGAEANQALKMRQRWLVQQQLMTDKNGQLVAQRRMLAELTKRDVSKVGSNLAKTNNLSHVSSSELERSNAKVMRSIRMASGRFAMMQKGKEFALIPWKQAMQMRKSNGLGIEAGKGVSR
jgi:type IV secretory pathway VirD2 relaxase